MTHIGSTVAEYDQSMQALYALVILLLASCTAAVTPSESMESALTTLDCPSDNPLQTRDVAPLGEFGEPREAYRFLGRIDPASAPQSGFFLAPKPWISDWQYFRPELDEVVATVDPRFSLNAARGEREPLTAVVLAAEDLTELSVKAAPLVGSRAVLASSCLTVRRVVRNLKRDYPSSAQDTAKLWNNWLPLWNRGIQVKKGEYREIFVEVEVPKSAPAGLYRGSLRIESAGQPARYFPVELEVHDFDLQAPSKHLGAYYAIPSGLLASEEELASAPGVLRQFRAELAEMQKRGIRELYVSEVGDVGLTQLSVGRTGEATFDASRAKRFLRLLDAEGFDGKIVMPLPFWSYLANATAIRTDFLSARSSDGTTQMDPKFRKAFDEAMRFFSGAYLDGLTRAIVLEAQILDEVQTHPQAAMAVERWIDLARHIRGWSRPRAGFWRPIRLHNTLALRGFNEDYFRRTAEQLNLLVPFLDSLIFSYSVDVWVWLDNPIRTSMAKVGDYFSGKTGGHYAWYGGPTENPRYIRATAGAYLWASPFQSHTTWGMHWPDSRTGRWPGSPFDDGDNHCLPDYVPLTSNQIKNGAVLPPCDYGDWNLFGAGYSQNPNDMMPTRQWIARSEGFDDLRYLTTLDHLLKRAPAEAPETTSATRFRNALSAMFRYDATNELPAASDMPCRLELTRVERATQPEDGIGGGSVGNAVMYTTPGRVAYTRLREGEQWNCLRRTIVHHITALRKRLH